ncbi:aminoglycoside phosphotransferase family protein [Deinococcus sp. HMF7604]|uniref:phosphotransferase family protein n=1 Tax=Deinococcus betulae TaxID=2873312 RepID=UPI001CCADB86|nr:aminoglycoside phosphotransferase family protein [Deinococcus betulae]MBZ9752408.1 aminoglycoside phosphotransferase family protein [Deinococcus betulae]
MPAEAQALADARTLLGPGAYLLARGATCLAYTDGRRVARLARTADARLGVQVQLQRRLAAQGVPVPPVLETGLLRGETPYSVDILISGDGQPPTAAGWADLGEALGALHHLPHEGYGLLEDRADGLRGQASRPELGIITRLPGVWPFGPVPLTVHPLIQADSALLAPLTALKAQLREAVRHPAAVCHTDLHAGQLIWRGGRLAALLDFGDAAAGPPAWDTASVAYFHGWAAAQQVAAAAGQPCGEASALFGVLLALHRASRAQRREQVRQAVTFAFSCLRRLGAEPPGPDRCIHHRHSQLTPPHKAPEL